MFDVALQEEAKAILELCRGKGIKLATAESCTGGLLAALFTEIAGSSDVFDRGFVTYSNDAKQKQLGVAANLLEAYGAVSEVIAAAMAHGTLKFSNAHLTVGITGIAGPGGATESKPVGLVYVAVAPRGEEIMVEECNFAGDRSQVRLQAVQKALSMLREALKLSFVCVA